MGFRNVNNLVHDALLAAPQNPYVHYSEYLFMFESPWEIALGQGGESAAPILPAPMLEDSNRLVAGLVLQLSDNRNCLPGGEQRPGPIPQFRRRSV